MVLLAALAACGPGEPDCRKKRCTEPDTSVMDTGEGVTDPGLPVTLAHSEVTCLDATPRDDRRFDRSESLAEVAPIRFWAAGVAVGDLDGDGLPDILLPGYAETLYYRGDAAGGRTLDATALVGLELDQASGASLADYDGDGDLDVLVTRFLARDRLLRNDGGAFTDVTDEAGLIDIAARSISSSWADYDGDGDWTSWSDATGGSTRELRPSTRTLDRLRPPFSMPTTATGPSRIGPWTCRKMRTTDTPLSPDGMI